jgi:hypothetical protein
MSSLLSDINQRLSSVQSEMKQVCQAVTTGVESLNADTNLKMKKIQTTLEEIISLLSNMGNLQIDGAKYIQDAEYRKQKDEERQLRSEIADKFTNNQQIASDILAWEPYYTSSC